MNAFERAWSLLKAPIRQGSVRRDYDADKYRNAREYAAIFDDPVSGEELPMTATMFDDNESDDVSAAIGQDDEIYNLPPRARAEGGKRDHIGNEVLMQGVNTDEEFQRRGYATALYDFIAYLLSHRNQKLAPHWDQSPDGKALWASRELDEEGHWPVRGDL